MRQLFQNGAEFYCNYCCFVKHRTTRNLAFMAGIFQGGRLYTTSA